MGDWSDYFEDFPEENPANLVNGRFDPAGAARERAIEEKRRTIALESRTLQRKMFEMAREAKRKAKEQRLQEASLRESEKKP